MRQLDLFGPPPNSMASDSSIAPAAECWDDAERIAASLPARLRLGTSSWSFPGWIGLLYGVGSDQRRLSACGLEAYAKHPLLRAVGVDSAYHAPIPRDRLRSYAEQVPRDFRFLVKAPALVTDPFMRSAGGRPNERNPGFLDPARAADLAVHRFVEELGNKGGVLLFQFPPLGREITGNPRRFAEDLYRFLRRLPQGPCYAVEIRDQALLTRDFVEALRHGGAQPTHSLHPRLPGLDAQAALFEKLPPGPLVVRWMLRWNRAYAEARSAYKPFDQLCEPDPAARQAIAASVARALADDREVYVIANNKAEGCAPRSLEALAEAVAKELQVANPGSRAGAQC